MKKLILSLVIITGCSVAALGLCSFASSNQEVSTVAVHTHSHAASQGKHCNGTVGCDCSGFSPITNGKEWQKSYCKNYEHMKSCHK